MFIPGASQNEHPNRLASLPVSSPTFFIKSISNEDAKAVEQGQPVEPKYTSDCLKPAGPSNVSPPGILYLPVIPELYKPPITQVPARMLQLFP